MKIFILQNQIYTKPLEYILLVLSQNKSFEIQFVKNKSDSDVIFDHQDENSEYIDIIFYESLIVNKQYDFKFYFQESYYITNNNNIDYLATAFYMINCFQEYDDTKNQFDGYGRFKYESSYQKHFDCIQENIVQKCFNEFCRKSPAFQKITNTKRKTKIFLSHDIDNINQAILQDGFWALKKGRLDIIFKLTVNALLLKPDWSNIDKIVNLHDAYNLKSTFFWLVTKSVGEKNITNADYSIESIKKDVLLSKSNGLHKSSCNLSFEKEIEVLPFQTSINRYHFLNFNLPAAWDKIEESPIKLDASLGFAENYGFRNSYALPFSPYNLNTKKAYSFVEVPLHVMDRTLHQYLKIQREKTASTVIDFLEKYQYDSIISILWHNNYFTNYKYGGYLKEYTKILSYIYENKIETLVPEEILTEFLFKKNTK